MKTLILTLLILLIASVNQAFAQTKNTVDAPVDTTTTTLTPEMFLYLIPDMDSIYSTPINYRQLPSIPILDKKFSEHLLFFGRSVIGNRYEHEFIYSFTPRTVTDYNRMARQQLYMPEHTLFERRTLPFIGRY
jgi:hypothetical protein